MEEPSELTAGRQYKGVILVLIATASLSIEAVAAKIAYAGGVNVISALVLRYVIAALSFWTILLASRKSFLFPGKNILRVVFLAAGTQAATVLFLFNAYRYIPAAIAILLLYLYPALVNLLSFLWGKESFTRSKILALVLTFAGCAFILGQPVHDLDMRGVAFSIGAALVYSLFLLGSSRLIKHIEVPVYNTYMTSFIAVFFILLGVPAGNLRLDFTPGAWGAVIVLGVVSTVIAMAALMNGMKFISASRAAIISTLEPAFTAVFALLLLGEKLSTGQVAGGLLVLAGVFLQRKE